MQKWQPKHIFTQQTYCELDVLKIWQEKVGEKGNPMEKTTIKNTKIKHNMLWSLSKKQHDKCQQTIEQLPT